MLNPHERLQLVSELRPPEGYEFDAGIGTTFSLDLISLLTVPLSLVLCEFESKEAALESPEAILEGLRRVSGKLHVFCHRGRIKRPKEGLILFSFLEDMVAGVLPANKKGAFHPKVWVLRYRRNEEKLLRVLVLSRNLTFDKSWDIAIVLEGTHNPDRSSTVQRNARLAQFLQALPNLSSSATEQSKAATASLADDVLRTEFDCPPDVDDLAFWPLGIGAAEPRNLFKAEHSRLMVISPFVSDLSAGRSKGVLDQLLTKRSAVERNICISRPDQLDTLAPESFEALKATTDIFCIDDAAAHGEPTEAESDETPKASSREELSGLHAKVYVIEDGAQVSILAGSANATSAGWGRHGEIANVEFMVELIGARRKIGINALLGDESLTERGAGGLRRILKPYHPPDEPPEVDADKDRVEKLIEEARQILAVAQMNVEITTEGSDSYCASLRTGLLARPAGVEYSVWPVMLPPGRAQSLNPQGKSGKIDFSPLPITALTPFWAFRVEAKSGRATQSAEFVLDLPVKGMPEGRTAALMAKMIDNSDRFLKYLAMLLADDPLLPGLDRWGRGPHGGAGNGAGSSPWDSAILLENLVRAFSRNPQRLDRIDVLLKDLRKGGAAPGVIPAEFAEIWGAFRPDKP